MRFLMFMNTMSGRAVRIVGGLVLFAIGAVVGGWLGATLALFAVLPIATGAFGLCPVNPLLGQPLRACSIPAERRTRQA